MKIRIKTLKSVEYEIDIQNESTVKEVKQAIESKYAIEFATIKLIYNGSILVDDKTILSYNIKEGSVLILMTTKIEKKNEVAKNEVVEKPKVANKEIKENKEFKYTEQMKQLNEMGFDQTQCLQAINAAKGSVQIAIEYLYNGIPPNLSFEDNGIINQNNIIENEEDYYNEEEDLYIPPEILDTINLEDPNALSNIASVLKVLISSSPNSLQNLLEEVEDTNPEIIDFIKQNETEFKSIMSQPINDDDRKIFNSIIGGVENPDLPVNVNHGLQEEENSLEEIENITKDFTNKDRESITNLVNLGFSEIEAIQAYIACGKNEAFAADFLFQDKN